MSKTVLAVGLTLLLFGAAGNAQKTPLVPSHTPVTRAANPLSAVVARVNRATLTERDLRREMQKLFPYTGVHGNRIPGDYSSEIRHRALNQIVLEELLHQEALRRGLVVSGPMFKDILQQAQERFADKAAYESYAIQEYGSVDAFQAQLRRGVLIALLLDREVMQKSKVSEAELLAFYKANQKRFQKPPSVSLQSITIRIPENATAQQTAWARKRAEDLLPLARAARTYEEFGRLAEKYSQDDWRVMMGDRRSVHRGRLPEAVEKVAFSLKEGETSGIIVSTDGFLIVRVNQVQPQTQIPFSQVSESLRRDLQQAREADFRARLEKRLRNTFQVEEM